MTSTSARTTCLLLVALAGCGPQASTEYRGEPLLSMRGSVELALVSEDEAADLLPALAFRGDHEFLVVDVEVEGEFPASFTLDVYEPPPEAAFIPISEYEPDSPQVAIGYITAAAADHPATFSFEEISTTGEAAACAQGSECGSYSSNSWCRASDGECYTETTTCPTPDAAPEDCTVTAEGDPTIKLEQQRDPWDNFAGLSENYVVVYLKERAPANTFAAQILGAGSEGLDAGYHLLALEDETDASEEAAHDCEDDAEALAADRYNAEHGTSFTWHDLESNECPGEPTPCGPNGETCPTYVECPEDAIQTWHLLVEDAQAQLGCQISEIKIKPVANPLEERIHVRIGDDVKPIGT